MKATELRIGNLVNCSDVVEQGVMLNVIDWQDLKWLSEDEKGFNLVHKPIPLTEEKLLKFGFYKNIDTELFEKDGFQIDISVIKCLFYLPEFGDWYKELEYLHQLQNLYFALTNEELTLTK